MKFLTYSSVLRLLCVLSGVTFMACAHDHSHEEKEEHKEDSHTGVIVLEPHQAKEAGLKTETVVKGAFYPALKTSGTIESANGTEQMIVATTGGMVSYKGMLTEGKAVRKGETLFNISAQGMENGDPIEKARLDLENAKKELERAEDLISKKIISQKEFDQIKLRKELAETSYSGIASKKNGAGVAVASGLNGFIKQILVQPGSYVAVGQPLALITQTQKLQLRAEVSERHYSQLSGIRSAEFRTESMKSAISIDSLDGRLVSVGKSLAQGSFFIPVTFELNNIGDILPGSFAEVWLIGSPKQNCISIPKSALTEEQGLYFVYIQKDSEHYLKKEVHLGEQNAHHVEIISGLQEKEKVVVQGAMQVRLASQSGTIPEGHNHSH